MKSSKAEEIYQRYLNGEASGEEIAWIESWYITEGSRTKSLREDLDYRDIENRIWKGLREKKRSKSKHLWPAVGIAAALAVIISGLFLINSYHNSVSDGGNKIVLGSGSHAFQNNATMLVINGQQQIIKLSDTNSAVVIDAAKVAYDDGTLVSDADVHTFTISTPRGKSYQVRLPDGTNVWLNAATLLSYTMPSKKNGGNRKVELNGEAYFEVFKNAEQPFIVKSKNMELVVLGTHFNVSAYDDDPGSKATLMEGSVKVASVLANGKPESVTLKPNQQALLALNSAISVREVDAAESISWKNGKFYFNREEMGEIMRKLKRWYDIDIIYHNNAEKVRFTGAISRYDDLSSVTKMLEATGELKFKIEGTKVSVSK